MKPNSTTTISQSTLVLRDSCVCGNFYDYFSFHKLGDSGSSSGLPSGITLNQWIPSTATSVTMTFTSNESGTRSGFEVLVGCPVTASTQASVTSAPTTSVSTPTTVSTTVDTSCNFRYYQSSITFISRFRSNMKLYSQKQNSAT